MNYSLLKKELKQKLQKLLLQTYEDIKLHNEEMTALIAAKDEIEVQSEEQLKFFEDLERDAIIASQETLELTQKLISAYEKL